MVGLWAPPGSLELARLCCGCSDWPPPPQLDSGCFSQLVCCLAAACLEGDLFACEEAEEEEEVEPDEEEEAAALGRRASISCWVLLRCWFSSNCCNSIWLASSEASRLVSTACSSWRSCSSRCANQSEASPTLASSLLRSHSRSGSNLDCSPTSCLMRLVLPAAGPIRPRELASLPEEEEEQKSLVRIGRPPGGLAGLAPLARKLSPQFRLAWPWK